MSKHPSYHSQLRDRHYHVEAYVPMKDWPKFSNEISHALSRNHITDFQILPSDTAFKGESWIPCEPGKVVYVKRPEEKSERNIVSVLCENIRTKKRKNVELI